MQAEMFHGVFSGEEWSGLAVHVGARIVDAPTAAVARRAYIHPLVLQAYEAGTLPFRDGLSGRPLELAVLRFLEEAREAAA